ncbi:MAG: FAD-dependent oxidoreductase, partial [Deltaproteobacteria bacterium]|nr:FAD-dependent oxidoreductase [Deltaproteobacteria bacterium]
RGAGRGGAEAVEVRSPVGGRIQVPWDALILAPGSRPLEIPVFPFDGEKVLSSNDALSPKSIPDSLLIVGGGVIGCEFASIYASLGTRVILVEGMSRLLPLPSVDEECSKVLQREMKKRRIHFHVGKTLLGLDEARGGLRAVVGPSPGEEKVKQGEPFTVEVEKVLVSVGRRANTDGIGLEEIGIRPMGKEWIAVNGRMETGAGRIYGIGDALGPSRPMLAYVASREGMVAAENAMGEKKVMGYDVVPAAIFTTPEIACVGLTEAQARERGDDVRADTVLFRSLGKPHVIGEIGGMAKIVSQVGNGRILGIHIVGPHATDLIGEGALALKMGCTVRDLAETVHPHPTLGEIMMEVSLKALDRGIHG